LRKEISKSWIAFQDKAQADEKGQHTLRMCVVEEARNAANGR
jgi:hypothetical protein